MRKRRGSDQMSTDEDSDSDFDVDDECDDNTAVLSHDDSVKRAASGQQNGVCADNDRPVDGLANDIKGPQFR